MAQATGTVIREGTPEFDTLFADEQTCLICHGTDRIWWQCVRSNDDPRIQQYEYRAACRRCGAKTGRYVTIAYHPY